MTFQVGEYVATERLGTGGSADVWLGVRRATGEPVALKVFTADVLPAVRREAALAAVVDHPHVVTVLDVVADGERAVLVTEYAAGGDLADLLARRDRLSPGETLTILLPLAAALATAHERQIVHGDITPANILFDRSGRPLLADLGGARAAFESGIAVATTAQDAAPELARGGPAGPATDMFSLGSVALACLTGRAAWPADDLRDVMIQAAAGQWPDPGDDAGPAPLVAAIRGLLEHDPARRPGAASLAVELRAAGRPEPVDLGTRVRSTGAASPGDPAGGAAGGGSLSRVGAAGGRHGRPDPVGPATGGADDGRQARARAATRLRPDLGEPSGGAPADERRLRGRRRRPAPADSGAPTAGGSATGGQVLRWSFIVVSCVLVAVLAAAAGVWWAGNDRADPIALASTAGGPSDASTTAPTVRSATPTGTRPTGTRPAGGPTTIGTAQSGRAPATGPAPTTPARTRPAPTRPAPTTAVPTGAASSVPPRATSAPPGPAVEWAATIRALDVARSRALVARDPALLDAVYTAGSPSRSADVLTIRALLADGLRVSGAEHLVHQVAPVPGRPMSVLVTDSMPAYDVLDAGGAVVGRTPARTLSSRIVELARTAEGVRISKVDPA